MNAHRFRRSRKRTPWGKVDQRPRPESDRITATREDLRIIDDALWQQVADRLKTARPGGSGRPSKREGPKNLLAGLATCGLCGGGLIVHTHPLERGSKTRVAHHVCPRRRYYGSCTCQRR